MARTLALLALLTATASGCQNYDKPRDLRNKSRPNLSQFDPEEQERRVRSRYSIPQDGREVGPSTGLSRNTPLGW
jgi:hypothetical protein